MYRIDNIKFEEGTIRSTEHEENTLNLELKGYNGPLDLLVSLAQSKKLDITKISILSLVDQYLDFIKRVKKKNLNLASDYLVMAAVLAYIKSKLLIPEESDEDLKNNENLPQILEFNLKRLMAMRNAYAKIHERNLLGEKRYLKGYFSDKAIELQTDYYCNKNSLIICFANTFNRKGEKNIKVKIDSYYSTELAISRIREFYKLFKDWSSMKNYMPQLNNKTDRGNEFKSVLISIISATLEMAKSGELLIKQEKEFGEILLKRKS